MEKQITYHKDKKINWYRCKVDPKLMSQLMECSDWQGYFQAVGHLLLWFVTGTLAYLAFRNISSANWMWSVPLLWLALFVHGSFGCFLSVAACHELSHKTVFKNKSVNEFFLRVYAFFGWWDQVLFRPSHIRHHQVTVYHEYDGEVSLPAKLSFRNWQFWLGLFGWNPVITWQTIKFTFVRATGGAGGAWVDFLMPRDTKQDLRRQHQNWARFLLIGHGILATIFIVTGHWFLIVIFCFGTQYAGLLAFLCIVPQHYGLTPDVPDHRMSCRSFTCSPFVGFLYWNMQHHAEHHMFPAVPFFNLGKLRKAIEHDLPPAPHGLWATWKEILVIHRKSLVDPNYCYAPPLPKSAGDRAEDDILEREATLAV